MKKLGLILILFIALSVGVVNASSDPIGYEITGDVVEIWNPDTSYYFDKTNGVQWVENPDVYWSRNVFSVGYYSGTEWVQMYSADDLGAFNKEIDSDYSSYVNATLWKDFTYNGYDLRLGINYYLGVDDTDLSVTPFIKNLDYRVYPVPLGFSWTITDIDIPNPHNNDRIYINQTYYPLDGVYDVTFTDMRHVENGTTVYDANYRISDYTEFLTLEWGHTLPYSVRLQGNGVQGETTVTWMVNAGIFQPGQTKQTTLYWADAEGDYIGVWILEAGPPDNADPTGITTNGTHIWVVDTGDDDVYLYHMNGTYIELWALNAGNSDARGITNDGTNIWVGDTDDQVYKYLMDGTYIGLWAQKAPENADTNDVATDGTNIWTVDYVDEAVYKYSMAGAYVNTWNLNATNTLPTGLYTNGTNIWVVSFGGGVHKYDMAGVWDSLWSLELPENGSPRGLTSNVTRFYVSDNVDDAVYEYVAFVPPTPPINLGVTSLGTFGRDVPGWFNVTVQDLNGVADLFTVTIQVNTTGDSQNFTLRWTQATNTFSEVSDLSNICELNPESIRVNVNSTTDTIAFNFNITGGQSGLCDVRVTSIDDIALSDIDLYSNAFEFSFYNWNPTADLIDSAFEQFGIIGYLTSITTWINGLVSKFESSLTRVLALILLQFTIIEQVYGFFTGWATDLFATALTFSTFYHQIMDGTSPWIQPIYAIGNFWDLIGYDSWAPAVPMLLFIWWLDSMPKRAQQTVGGEFQVFINDINTAIGLISYFVSIFSYVANAIIDRVYGLFPAIT